MQSASDEIGPLMNDFLCCSSKPARLMRFPTPRLQLRETKSPAIHKRKFNLTHFSRISSLPIAHDISKLVLSRAAARIPFSFTNRVGRRMANKARLECIGKHSAALKIHSSTYRAGPESDAQFFRPPRRCSGKCLFRPINCDRKREQKPSNGLREIRQDRSSGFCTSWVEFLSPNRLPRRIRRRLEKHQSLGETSSIISSG